MKWSVLLALLMIMPFIGRAQDKEAIIGKWDLTVNMDGKQKPSWLEVKKSGTKTLVGRYVGVVGSARPISEVHIEEGVMRFSIPPQWWGGAENLEVSGTLSDGKLSGSLTLPDGRKYSWTGERAPSLKRSGKPSWGTPIPLFNGDNMDAWKATGENQWVIEDGVLKSPHSGANLFTKEQFNDFKLHIEVKYPKGSNSGIYLRGRYEVQVVDSKGLEPSDILFGAIYGFLTPSEIAAKAAGKWQSIDITLVGRTVTVEANGKTVICNRLIPGITGGAIDSKEGEPGPILLQGDHGPVEYRNIIITPAK